MALTETQFPYTGPYYGPGDKRGLDKGPTAEALKRAMARLGYMPWTQFDDIYNQNLQSAMADWQINAKVGTATGQYGKASWTKIRSQKIPNGPHAGEYALDGYAIALVRNEAIHNQKPTLCYPYPIGEGGGICQGLHPTAGLLGNWAIDFCDTPGARVLAVEAGTIQKLSGHPPADDTADAAGTFGWNTYIRTSAGYVYFITHLGWQNPKFKVGVKVVPGDVIGKVGDQHYRPDHCHYGVTSPLGVVDAMLRITAVSKAPRIPIT